MRMKNRLTPVAHTRRLLCPRIKHGGNNQEARCYRTLTDAKDEANCEETTEALARRMCAQSNGPNEYIDAER